MNTDILTSLFSIYIFVLIGFIAKKRFKSQLDNRSFTLLSVYALQPILAFWGLSIQKLDFSILFAPVLYLIAIFVTLFFTIIAGKILYLNDEKKSAVVSSMSLIGNTGNIGIPIGIALFGVQSVPFTSMINLANVFFIYTVGAYLLAKSEYNFREAIKSIAQIPILWVSIFAIFYNIYGFGINSEIEKSLEMGAKASIVIQLIIFGIYLGDIKLKEFDWSVSISLSFFKLIFLPLIGSFIISIFIINEEIAKIIIMELLMPLAVNNVNMAVIYNSYPEKVAGAIVLSSILFVPIFIILY